MTDEHRSPLADWHVAQGAEVLIEDGWPWYMHEGTDPLAEYEAIRTEPTQFFVAPTEDHVSTDIEYIVRREPSYWVLAKVGVGADMSRREQDPRRL